MMCVKLEETGQCRLWQRLLWSPAPKHGRLGREDGATDGTTEPQDANVGFYEADGRVNWGVYGRVR